MNIRYIIKDRSGKICFNCKTFKTIEEASEYLYESFGDVEAEDDSVFDDYSIIELE